MAWLWVSVHCAVSPWGRVWDPQTHFIFILFYRGAWIDFDFVHMTLFYVDGKFGAWHSAYTPRMLRHVALGPPRASPSWCLLNIYLTAFFCSIWKDGWEGIIFNY